MQAPARPVADRRALFKAQRPPRRRALALLLLLTLLAFALRVSHLALESLDIDEADGAAFIASGLPELIARLFRNGENGPLYYLLLHVWSQGAGITEFALRFPSVIVGTLTVPLVFTVMRRLAGTRTALIAALLAATSTYLIHYAQMVKMYALVAALATLATYTLLLALDSGKLRWWAAYTAAVSVTFYTHIFGVLLLPWHMAFVALRWRSLPKPTRTYWLGALACLILPYLPLGLWHLDNLRNISLLTRQFTGARNFPSMLAELAGEYGARLEDVPRFAVSLLFLSLALLGLLALTGSTNQRRRQAGWLLAFGAALPVGVVALLVAAGAPVYSPRYLMITFVPFLGLWSAGLAAALVQRPALGLAGLAVVLALNGAQLAKRDLGGMAFREDWRGAMGYIGRRAQPGDAIMLLSSAAGNAFRYYGSQQAGMIDTEALRRQAGDSGFDQALGAMANEQRRLWLAAAYFELPDYPPVQSWLSQHTHYEREVWFRNVRVALHAPLPDPSFTPPAMQQPLSLNFGDQIELTGLDRGQVPTRPGEPWQLRLVWRAPKPPEADLAASLRIMDDAGTEWGRSDGPLGGAFQRTSQWRTGQVVVDDREVPLTPGMPPGRYRVGLYVYRRDTVVDLPLVPPPAPDPAFASLGTLQLDAAIPVDAALLPVRSDASYTNGLTLLGTEALPERASPGGAVPLTLVYTVDGRPTAGAALELTLEDAAERTVVVRQSLGAGQLEGGGTAEGAPLAQRWTVPVPLRFAGGAAKLKLSVLGADGRAVPRQRWGLLRTTDPLTLGSIEIQPRPYRTALPDGLVAHQETFGDGVSLAGVGELPAAVRRGGDVPVRLAWRAAGEPAQRWTVSVQILDRAGKLVAQADRPIGGGVPSDGWLAGEVTDDSLDLALKDEVPAGAYRLVLALYHAADGARLRTEDGRDSVELTRLQVEP